MISEREARALGLQPRQLRGSDYGSSGANDDILSRLASEDRYRAMRNKWLSEMQQDIAPRRQVA